MPKRKIASAKLNRIECRVRFIKGSSKVVGILCGIAVGFVVLATAFPQRKELQRLEQKLLVAQNRESQVNADREFREIEYRALREDPAYLENHARDRLDYYREGERVLKFKSE